METRAAAEKWITEIFTKSLDEATTFELTPHALSVLRDLCVIDF